MNKINLKLPIPTILISLLLLLISFSIHFWILKDVDTGKHTLLIKTYVVNYILLLLIVFVVDFISKNFIDHLGFLFIALIAIKFLILFLVFYSDIKSNDKTNKLELFALIIPYFICLILSTTFAFNKLNESN